MDIYCKHCGEPWEADCLHDIPESYAKASQLFKTLGCGAFGEAYNNQPLAPCQHKPIASQARLDGISALQDMSQHPDDWASDGDLLDMLIPD
jgi:hypothetical protein